MAFPSQIDSAGIGAHQCSLTVDAPVNSGYPGVFSDGPNDRYAILGDLTAFKLRCYKSSDGGNTFVEQDAANAPAMANDIGSPLPHSFELWCSCYDPALKIIYTVFFEPVGFFIAIKPFKVGTGWQATVISGFSFEGIVSHQQGYNLGCEFRPNDATVWMAYTKITAADPAGLEQVYGAKFAAGAWDGALTLLAGTVGDGFIWILSGLRRDSLGNIRYIVGKQQSGMGNQPSTLLGGVIHPGNGLAGLQTIMGPLVAGIAFDLISIPWISATNRISFCFLTGARGIVVSTHNVNVARAQGTADAPVWTIETPDPIQLPAGVGGGGINYLKGTITDNGVDYVFYNYYTNGGNTANFAYISDNGNGVWSAEQLIGTIDTSGAGIYTAAGVCIPAQVGSWGVVFELIPTVPGVQGMGFWAGAGIAPAIALPKIPLLAVIPFPIKRCLTPRRAPSARPELVHCIQMSPDGKLYVPVKGPLMNRECC